MTSTSVEFTWWPPQVWVTWQPPQVWSLPDDLYRFGLPNNLYKCGVNLTTSKGVDYLTTSKDVESWGKHHTCRGFTGMVFSSWRLQVWSLPDNLYRCWVYLITFKGVEFTWWQWSSTSCWVQDSTFWSTFRTNPSTSTIDSLFMLQRKHPGTGNTTWLC